MNQSIAQGLPIKPARREVKLAGLEEKIAATRANAMGLIAKAAHDLGDTISYHVVSSEASRPAAVSRYKDVTKDRRQYLESNLWLFLGTAGAGLLATIWNVIGSTEAVEPFKTGSVMVIALLFIIAFSTMADALRVYAMGLNDQKKCVKAFGERGSNVWGVGEKAIYAVEGETLQKIRIDAIGSVDMGGHDIVLSSRFGQSSVSLECPVCDTRSLDDILSDIRSRIV